MGVLNCRPCYRRTAISAQFMFFLVNDYVDAINYATAAYNKETYISRVPRTDEPNTYDSTRDQVEKKP